ncbi:RICIN domain-containing protein [Streptomyces sp. CA-111067]|uniref:RICIN domain-containing protein n=1 Tax=Streptomyces sp. CA-111067 TaxID=3240046 RepID=UPI003D966835
MREPVFYHRRRHARVLTSLIVVATAVLFGAASASQAALASSAPASAPQAPAPASASASAPASPRAAQAVGAAPTDGYAVADDGALSTVDLSGAWSFTPVSPAAPATSIQVPGGGWVKQGFTSTTEAVYARSITIPASAAGNAVILALGAVNFQATLKIGSTTVGTTTTSFKPTSFDLTPYVSAGNTYTISLDIKGRDALKGSNGLYLVPEAASWTKDIPEGIYRSVYLRVYPSAYVSNTFVQTSVADSTVTYQVTVKNVSGASRTVALNGGFSSWNGSSFPYPGVPAKSVTVAAHSSSTVTIGPLPWTAGPASYWWPNVPYSPGYKARLHILTVTASSGSQTQSVNTLFGFRQFTQPANQTHYYLNGVPINLRGDDLQGADYDGIDNGGVGDAYDTLPGFLPPANGNGGWPAAVDNYQHLNYNVVRLHQETASPYMLDVLDEMGMMVIDESAIRGSNGAEDFVNGRANMVGEVQNLAMRDRNHASVIEWSQSNEGVISSTDSQQFEEDLFHAIRAIDPTRPIIVDGENPSQYPDMTPANGYTQFDGIPHYLDGFSTYGTNLPSSTAYPNGEGEYVWPAGSTRKGFTYFATSTVGKRGKGGADLRPYTLLSGWAGFVPGVSTTDFTTEEGRAPLYGANNLPSPWTNPQITLIQAAFNPLLAADLPYWNANGASDDAGDYPVPGGGVSLQYGQAVSRTVTVFNDMLSGTSVQFSWSAHTGSPTGPVIGSGSSTLDVPLAGRTSTTVSFTAPTSGSAVYLTLQTAKNGTTLFSDAREMFSLGSSKTVVGVGSGRCMDVYGGGTVNGSPVDIWDCNGQANQQWSVKSDGTIVGVQSGLCLDAYGQGTTNGTVVTMWSCNGQANQKWTPKPDGTIVGVQSGLCLDVSGAATANGTAVQLYSCNGGSNQEWT